MTETDPPAGPESSNAATPRGKPNWVVGIGAGAGGLEAIQLLFAAMPADSGMAFVICRRLQASLSDPLADLLRTQTTMPVVQAEDGTPIETGHIYLASPDARLVLLKDRLVRFTADGDEDDDDTTIYLGISPIDILLHSLAASAGSSAIAVMLSGNDQDGLRGCASIRERGGLVLVQHPESTEFSAMPRSVIEADLASAVAPPGALPDLIWRHVGKKRQIETARDQGSSDEDALARIVELLELRFSIDPQAYRPSLIATRVRRRLARSGAGTLARYAARLADDERELAALHDDLLIRVTAFFRDPEAFAVLERKVLPVLVERMSEERPIRVWVPACASGEEAYSLAMLLLDRIERSGKPLHLEVLASDRHEAALKLARAGRYRRERIDQVPPGLAAQYLDIQDTAADVGALLRRHVTFVDHDILNAPPPDDIDLVSCRNLLIYLAMSGREKAIRACCDALRPDGFLFLGPSEQPGPKVGDLEAVHGKWRIYRRTPPPASPVGAALDKIVDIKRARPAEVLRVDGRAGPTTSGDPEPAVTVDPGKRAKRPADIVPKLLPSNYLEGVMVENQRMLESTIDTLLASNDQLRRRNRDLRAENQRLTHAHAALDDVATMIAHDLKAPLRTVDRLAERLKTTLLEPPAPDRQAPDRRASERPASERGVNDRAIRCLQPMKHQLSALNRLIDDLLIYARQGPVDQTGLHDVDFGDLLRETLTLIGLPKGVQVMMRPQSLQARTWRVPLACIFRNLLGQAIGRIGDRGGIVRIEVKPADRFLEVTIADDGRQAGDCAGDLGLAIVHQLLDAAGGHFRASKTKADQGRHVAFTWPIGDAIQPAASAETMPSA